MTGFISEVKNNAFQDVDYFSNAINENRLVNKEEAAVRSGRLISTGLMIANTLRAVFVIASGEGIIPLITSLFIFTVAHDVYHIITSSLTPVQKASDVVDAVDKLGEPLLQMAGAKLRNLWNNRPGHHPAYVQEQQQNLVSLRFKAFEYHTRNAIFQQAWLKAFSINENWRESR